MSFLTRTFRFDCNFVENPPNWLVPCKRSHHFSIRYFQYSMNSHIKLNRCRSTRRSYPVRCKYCIFPLNILWISSTADGFDDSNPVLASNFSDCLRSLHPKTIYRLIEITIEIRRLFMRQFLLKYNCIVYHSTECRLAWPFQ